MTSQRWQICFEGRVQGVGFRYHACRLARQLNLTGWVRNLADGRVEVCAEGPVTHLKTLVEQLVEGPGFVDDHQVVKSAATGEYREFDITA